MADLEVANRQPEVQHFIFGGAGIAGLYSKVSWQQAVNTLQRALDLGFTYFDTAPWYGAGMSEDYFGHILGQKTDITISTKVGRVIRNEEEVSRDNKHAYFDIEKEFLLDGKSRGRIPVHDYSGVGVLESFQQSLTRLQDHPIKCLRLHDAENEEYMRWATSAGNAVDTLLSLRSSGRIEQISLGFNSAEYLLKYIRRYPIGTFDNVMMARCWNLLDFSGYELLLECQSRGIKVHLATVFGSGLLWGVKKFNYNDAPADKVALAEKWAKLGQSFKIPLPALAINFAFLPTCVEKIAIGCKTPEQVEGNVELCKYKVPVELWHQAKDLELLPDWVPIPPLSSQL